MGKYRAKRLMLSAWGGGKTSRPHPVAPQIVIPRPSLPDRHPELGSGSIYQPKTAVYVARWMLNRVQHDVAGNAPLRLCVNPFSSPQRRLGPIPPIVQARRSPGKRDRFQQLLLP